VNNATIGLGQQDTLLTTNMTISDVDSTGIYGCMGSRVETGFCPMFYAQDIASNVLHTGLFIRWRISLVEKKSTVLG
ncbi:MAG: hypothetical protein GY795_23700, partial [Desulfobacterales bacterium]|nr:hypothetical protein [Desulfobacterales bacterium]